MTRIAAAIRLILLLLAINPSTHARADTSSSVYLPLVTNGLAPVAVTCAAVNREYEREVMRLLNVERAKVGLSGLAEDRSLTMAARCHSLDMATLDFLSHTGSNGSTAPERLLREGYTATYVGEIVGSGYITPQDEVNGWMGSSLHRAILLLPTVTEFGAGYGYNPALEQASRWTVDFGSAR